MTYRVQNHPGYARKLGMRVVSLVPSITETLAECGVNLVARTRFCAHPESIRSLPAVGGTKDLKLEKLTELAPDLLILDREENLPWMKDQAPCAVHVFHAVSVEGMAEELLKLASVLEAGVPGTANAVSALRNLAERYSLVAERPRPNWRFDRVPGIWELVGSRNLSVPQSSPASAVIKDPSIESHLLNLPEVKKLIYVIWKNPWMRVGSGTYIYSVLEHLGAGEFISESASAGKYPTFELADFSADECFFMFSSEPYPFAKHPEQISELGLQAAIVDGEGYSWFGIRSLRFLEANK